MPIDPLIVGLTLGRWQTNCWIVGDRASGRCAVIDPGESGATEVPAVLDELELACEAILVTHGHLDHVWAVPALATTLDVPIHAHPADRWLWDDPLSGIGYQVDDPIAALAQTGLDWQVPTDRFQDVADHDRLTVAGIDWEVRHTPGHTPGHVTFLGRDLDQVPVRFAMGRHENASDQVLFSGDLIFEGSVGRTDFPRGSTSDLLASIDRVVLPLDDDTLILSGHGGDTTVGRERATNPFIARARGL